MSMHDIVDMRAAQQTRRGRPVPGWYLWAPFVVVLLALVLWGPLLMREGMLHITQYTDTHYAFYLANGDIVYGKVRGVGGSRLVLGDAYLFQTVTVGDTSTNNLVAQRENPLTRPADWMVITRDHIVFYEEVGRDAPVMRAIQELK